MPHVIVKLWPGKSERQKQALADDVTAAVMNNLGTGADPVWSVSKKSNPPRGPTKSSIPTSATVRANSTNSPATSRFSQTPFAQMKSTS